MRRPLAALLILVALIVVACGSDGSDTATGDDDTASGGDDTASDGSPDDGQSAPGGDDSASDAPLDDGRSASGGDSTATRPVDGVDAYPVANLDVTVTHPDRAAVTYVVSCLGDTATVLGSTSVRAESACLALNDPEVVTLLTEGPAVDRICTEQYGGPDEAVIGGLLDGVEVDVTITRTNGCGIDDWDRVLAAVLPPAIGVTS
ncbi:MAG: hypothetical protein RIE08_01375 [Acidimicrobiales bacterium]